jgi:N6-L-threonylcarbamoyladenine synthase
MIVLGIDTSFDDTAAAVVEDTTILSNVLSSEIPLYQEWGGVVPRLARQSHEEHIDGTIELALQRAKKTWDDINAIAVTYGPGLAITLEIGIAKAIALSSEKNIPLVAINHMEGHLLSVLAQPNRKQSGENNSEQKALFPAMAILVSGGHTQFVVVEDIGKYTIVGETQDDAMGEAFDKVGRMLGLGYPAGALIERFARFGISGKIVFPVPMRSVKNAHTSFSGLKTAAMRIIEPIKQAQNGQLSKQDIADISYGFQKACMTHIEEKLRFALDEHPVHTLMLGGGVAANMELRRVLRKVAKEYGLTLQLPYTKKLCVDNAAMIALAGYFHAKNGEYFTDLSKLDRNPVARLGSEN